MHTVHEYGGNPPDAPSASEYPVPAVPANSDDVVIPSAALTVNGNAFVVLPPPLSDNRTVKEYVPAAEAVPLMIPVDAARLKPAGKVPVISTT